MYACNIEVAKVFMNGWKLGVLLVVFAVIMLFGIWLFQPQLTHKSDLQLAVENAVDYFEGSSEPYALLWLDVIYRRFGIVEFADALKRYDQLLKEQPENAQPLYRIFRRIADHDNLLQTTDLAAVSSEVDLIAVPALYCDQLALPDDYPEMLENAVEFGDYQLTHVMLALIWVQENGCELVLPDGFIEDVYFTNAALINGDNVVTDLELEAAAFLYLSGQGELIDSAFIESVMASQNDDGGWALSSDSRGDSHWHSTILGLLFLLHVEFPSNSYPPVLDSSSP